MLCSGCCNTANSRKQWKNKLCSILSHISTEFPPEFRHAVSQDSWWYMGLQNTAGFPACSSVYGKS